MAKITVTGDAAVITSTAKLEDIKNVERYRPEALVLYGGEDNKEPIFAVASTDKNGSINEYGASFGSEAHDGSGLATITMIIGGFDGDSIKDFLADKLGGALTNLGKIEEKLPAVVAEIAAERAIVMSNIIIQ